MIFLAFLMGKRFGMRSKLLFWENLYLRILGEYVHGISTSASDDLNEIYKRYNAGMAVLILTSVTKNAPGAGVLLHFQRLNKNDISAGSFLVSQVCFLMNGNILYRIGSSNGNGSSSLLGQFMC